MLTQNSRSDQSLLNNDSAVVVREEQSGLSWKKVACLSLGTAVGLAGLGLLGYQIYNLIEFKRTIDRYPSLFPNLTYANAQNAVVNGTVVDTYTPDPNDCRLDPSSNITENIFWAKNLYDEGYTFISSIFGNSTAQVKERGLAYLQQIENQFPMLAIGWGVIRNLGTKAPVTDYNAVYYTVAMPLSRQNPLYLSDCEKPFPFSSDSTILVDGLPERGQSAAKQETKQKNNRYGFYGHKELKAKRETDLSVSDVDMAYSVFSQSHLAQRLRRQ